MDHDHMGTLNILGAGIGIPGQLTLETMTLLLESNQIFTILPEELIAALELPSDRVITVRDLYIDGVPRRDNYVQVVKAILQAAREFSAVSWLTYGHPLVFDSVSASLLAEGPAAGVRVQAYPGISSIDQALCYFGIDPADGLMIADASAAVGRDLELNPSVGLVLLQVNVLLSHLARKSSSSAPPPSLDPLSRYLSRFYSGEHDVRFVRFGVTGQVSSATTTRVGDLVSLHSNAYDGTLLYVPPAGPSRIADPDGRR